MSFLCENKSEELQADIYQLKGSQPLCLCIQAVENMIIVGYFIHQGECVKKALLPIYRNRFSNFFTLYCIAEVQFKSCGSHEGRRDNCEFSLGPQTLWTYSINDTVLASTVSMILYLHKVLKACCLDCCELFNQKKLWVVYSGTKEDNSHLNYVQLALQSKPLNFGASMVSNLMGVCYYTCTKVQRLRLLPLITYD